MVTIYGAVELLGCYLYVVGANKVPTFLGNPPQQGFLRYVIALGYLTVWEFGHHQSEGSSRARVHSCGSKHPYFEFEYVCQAHGGPG